MRALLGLGSNVGDREAHLAHALRRLGEETRLTGVSSIYETEPIGFADQPRFLNLVARVETPLEPAELLVVTRRIEAERERERSFRNAPRTLDIDILLIDGVVVAEDDLTVPHPRLFERAFVLVPLLELEPEATHPGTGQRLAELLEGRDVAGVRPLGPGERLIGGEST